MDTNFDFLTLFIMRGLPGSGKTSIAQSILGGSGIDKEVNGLKFTYCNQGVICSSDFYSSSDKNQKVQKSVEFAMTSKVPAIVLDEDNITRHTLWPFISLANKHGYKLVVIEIPNGSLDIYAQRNTHGYNKKDLVKMKGDWETFNFPGLNGLSIKEESK